MQPDRSATTPDGPLEPCRAPRAVLAVLLLAGVSFALSQTMVVPALQALGEDLGTTRSAASWLLTGYLLSASVATPIVGKLGDLYGKGRMLTIVMLMFAAGSVICALGTSIGVVVAGRVVQGVAGGVFPLAFGIIRDTFPRERVASGLGIMSSIFGIGGGIGLPLSGVVVANLDLSWLFWVGLIAVPTGLAAHFIVPQSPTVHRAQIDWAGAALLSLALATILFAVTEANAWGWTSPATLGLFAFGLAALIAWTAVEARVREPLIELKILAQRGVAFTNLTALLVGFAMFSSFLAIPQFAQAPESTGYGFGMSVTESGLLLVPVAASQLVVGPLAGRLGKRFGFRALLAVGGSSIALAFGWLAIEHSTPWHFVVNGVLLGAGITFALASMANLIVDVVDQSEVGVATGINTVTRTVGGSFGSAVSAAILTAAIVPGLGVPTEGAYATAFALAGASGLLAVMAALAIPTARSAARTAAEEARAPSPAGAPS